MPHLVILAGFVWHWEAMAVKLRSRFPPHEIEFFGRDRPGSWPGRTYEYRDALTRDVVEKIFGGRGETGFCAKAGDCAIDQGKWSRANCRKDIAEKTACRRQRPDMMVFVCTEEIYPKLFEKFCRAALFIRIENDECSSDELHQRLRRDLPKIRVIKDYLTNLSNTNFAPRVPFVNFQLKTPAQIAESAQSDLSQFCEVMKRYHTELYLHSFQNAKKPKMRGAYMLSKDIGFQRDRLHDWAYLGEESRRDGYHLLNAFHMYGLAITPGWHFDVSRRGGGSLGRVFTDALTGAESEAREGHVNITPCDRLI